MTESNKKVGRAKPLMEAALAYAKLGYAVFPCFAKSKKPQIRNGFKGATKQIEKQIEEWWGD